MERFQGGVELTDAAITSGERLNPHDVPAGKLWGALEAMDQVARMWQNDELPPLGREGALKELG